MEDKKYLGQAPMLQEPQKKLLFSIKNGAVTTEKIANRAVTTEKIQEGAVDMNQLSDTVKDWINSLGSGEAPSGLEELIRSIVISELGSIPTDLYSHTADTSIHTSSTERNATALAIQNLQNRVSELVLGYNNLDARVTALENPPVVAPKWYIGQWLDHYDVTEVGAYERVKTEFSNLTLEDLLVLTVEKELTDKQPQFTIDHKAVWFVMVPDDVTRIDGRYTAGNITSTFEDIDNHAYWQEFTHSPITINGVSYRIRANFNAALLNYAAWAQFIITT